MTRTTTFIRGAAGPAIALAVSGLPAELFIPAEYALSIKVLSIVMVWAAPFAPCCWCRGKLRTVGHRYRGGKECRSIHSACALFITSLLVGHLFLKSLRAKVCLALLAIPIAMFTNAVRIVTLWSLATKVDIGFLYGNLHRNGGILFSVVSLSILIGCLSPLRKLEGDGQPLARLAPVA